MREADDVLRELLNNAYPFLVPAAPTVPATARRGCRQARRPLGRDAFARHCHRPQST